MMVKTVMTAKDGLQRFVRRSETQLPAVRATRCLTSSDRGKAQGFSLGVQHGPG